MVSCNVSCWAQWLTDCKFGSRTRPLKFISAPLKAKHFIGQLRQVITASNVGARTQAWQAKWAVLKIPAVCLQALPSFLPHHSPLFYHAIFRAVFDSRSSFFAPKPHGNACYAGYNFRLDYVFVWKAPGEVPRASEESPIAKKMW